MHERHFMKSEVNHVNDKNREMHWLQVKKHKESITWSYLSHFMTSQRCNQSDYFMKRVYEHYLYVSKFYNPRDTNGDGAT